MCLEVELQSELNQSRLSGCSNASEVCRANASVRVAEVCMVEDIEELRSELDDFVFTDPGALHHREVEDHVARSVENVATETAEPSAAQSQ